MRNAIRNKLLPLCERVYQPFMANKETVKPFIVVRIGTEIGYKRCKFNQIVQIWPYVARGNFNTLTTLNEQIIGLFEKEFTYEGFTIQLEYEGSVGQEYYDPDWQALTQGLEFSYVTIHERR